jgi:uncharacterized protein YbjT (DUF2867 family)
MTIGILGANGFIGQHLITRLLQDTDHKLLALSPKAMSISQSHPRLQKHAVDVFDTAALAPLLQQCDTVYYLIHMMALKHVDFAAEESRAAEAFCSALLALKDVSTVNKTRVIYLGGLGSDQDKLSKHLASRHHTGVILRKHLPHVIELRASMVIGDGSISYDIIASLVHKLPILTLPSWSKTLTQPIGLQDALSYLIGASTVKLSESGQYIVEIGGPEQMSYRQLMERYARWKHTKAIFIQMPIIPVSIAAWWLNLFTPKRHAKVGRAMVESLVNPMIVTNDEASRLFPNIHPQKVEDVFV